MKNTLISLLIPAAVLAAGCTEAETDSPAGLPLRREAMELATVHVGFSSTEMGDGTKSVVSQDVENFTEAYLFAFWASGADAGKPCTVGGAPAAVYTDSKSFNWTLPANEPIEVMAVVNAVDDIRREIDLWAAGIAPYTRDELLSFTFSCSSPSDLMDLQDREYNMPMTGSVTVTIDPEAPSLTIPVKRLFAKFDITLDVSSWASDGWTVNAAHVSGARSNTEVPYFYTGTGVGFKQTAPGKFAAVDSSTDEDLDNLDFRDADNRSKAVSYYFLENCQSVSGSASKWSTVALDLGSAVDNCSYLKINVGATKPGYGERRFGYRIYLDSTPGSAMKSGFNIIRNTYRSIILKLGSPQDGFLWTNTSALTAAPGETLSIPFETTLDSSELFFLPLGSGIEYVSHSFHSNTEQLTGFPSGGTAVFQVSGSASDGNYSIRGGNSSGDISDEVSVQVVSPVTLTYSLSASHYAFQRFTITLHSEDMTGWSSAKKARLEEVFANLSLRSTSIDTHLISEGAAYYSGNVLNKVFTVMSTRAAAATFEAYNTASDVTYNDISVSIDRPVIHFIQTLTGPYVDNSFIGLDDEGDEGPIYDTPITGQTAKGYFQICSESGTAILIQAEDLALGSLGLTGVLGFPSSVSRATFSPSTFYFSTYLDDWICLEGDGFYSNVDDVCEFISVVYSPDLQLRSESGQLVCSEPVHLKVTNPFAEWFRTDDLTPFTYSVIVDGSSNYVTTDDFSSRWPYWADFQPSVISHGNVNTSKGSYSPYSLIWDSHANEVERLSVANDLHNHGLIEIGGTITHTRTGDTMTMLWGRVNVIREYVIYAGYQFSQVNYLSSPTAPANSGSMSRFIPYIFVRDNTGMPVSLRNCVRTTATSQSGINSVNPSENFYAETCRTEHWWPEHANMSSYDHSNSTLWDCEYSDTERSYLLQNKVVVYPSAKTVTSRGELSYYELQYVGPVADSHLNFFLGHHGHHADNIYSFRSVAYWNAPAFEFQTAAITPSEVRTFPSGEKYLALGDYTRVRFFWRMKKSSLTKLNSYDTRYAIDLTQTFRTSYTSTGDGSTYYMYYFGEDMFKQAYTATAYYDPRRNTREKLKLYTPSIPFYRLTGNTAHAAFDGSVSGSYKEEDIVNSHKMGQAYGTADSFWLPGNQIE